MYVYKMEEGGAEDVLLLDDLGADLVRVDHRLSALDLPRHIEIGSILHQEVGSWVQCIHLWISSSV